MEKGGPTLTLPTEYTGFLINYFVFFGTRQSIQLLDDGRATVGLGPIVVVLCNPFLVAMRQPAKASSVSTYLR